MVCFVNAFEVRHSLLHRYHELLVGTNTVFTWLNAVVFIILVQKFDVKLEHYSILKNDVYTHDFDILCETNQMQQLFKVWHIIK